MSVCNFVIVSTTILLSYKDMYNIVPPPTKKSVRDPGGRQITKAQVAFWLLQNQLADYLPFK